MAAPYDRKEWVSAKMRVSKLQDGKGFTRCQVSFEFLIDL